MCRYCEPKTEYGVMPLTHIGTVIEIGHSEYGNGPTLRVMAHDGRLLKEVDINYCPRCGKALRY